MQAKKLAGPEAASQKYDLITALGSHALGCSGGDQRLIFRFVTLITARYNWRQGILHVGQREIAQLWSVDERTVKREMAKLRALGWLTLERPARRGRVTSYALDLIAIRAATRAAWPRVGSDFEARMRGAPEPAAGSTVVPFPQAGTVIGGDSNTGSKAASQDLASDSWGAMRQILRADDPAVFTIWFDALRNTDRVGDCLVLEAPSAFHATYVRAHYAERLIRALQRVGGRGTLRIIASVEVNGVREQT